MNYQALFSYFLLLYSCSSSQTKPKLTRRYLDGDKYVFVIDNLFPAEVVRGYYGLVTSGKLEGKISSWFYAYNDYYQNIETFNTSSNSPWVAPVNPEFFSDTALWNISRKVVEKLSGGREYFPYDVTFSMHRRLDFITASSKENNIDEDELMIRISLNKDFKRNDYGEAIFYKDSREILAAVYPKMGRMVVWNATVPFIFKPPAMSYVQAQFDILVRVTTSKEKAKQAIAETKRLIKKSESQETLGFALSDEGEIPVLDLSKYEKRRFHDSQGREIAVFDGLVDKSDLDALRLFLLHYNSVFQYQPFDGVDEEHDNVSWIAMLKVKDFVKSRLWKIVKLLATYLSGLDEWYPYDVSMNIIRNSHYPRIHEDCEPNEHEYTFLMYLTPDWEANNYGETAFFEEVLSQDGTPYPPGQQQYEWIASVRPRYGRIVIFRGIIPHSARPPSPGFSGARYTFACKVARNYLLAMSKSLRETLEYLEMGNSEDPAAYELLSNLMADEEDRPPFSIEFIERQLEHHRRKKEEIFEGLRNSAMKEISGAKAPIKDEL
ncbi:hypothetical protein pdam_00005246 [Pocillopora damicornis]|uniref:Prolyl 4-hydroxylase alpha subunit Fe(2+) 2OG dioxygenase domain-containing protein n=1 Tax=Pocillopora damicornis TaxID=46731 RepID=A0A3M6T537_POCDA|nr:uncharacterized protein LOC113682579 [Pocillopora damicornis]RMX35955.1 hypothetical protein pdam_00005246 [Pocillopora damicornis]